MQDEAEQQRIRAEAQARLAAIIESSDDAIVSKTLEGVITSWNRGAQRIFGWTAEEVIGRPITILIPPERQDEEPKILARLRKGERVDHFQTVRQRKDGQLIDISVTISPIRGDDGRIIGVSKVARDITLEKKLQRDLQEAIAAAEKARDSAEEANRAKDHFLSVLSHELRTPLTPVLAAISLLERDPNLPSGMVDKVAMIRRNVETEARLVEDLLDITRIARGKVTLHFEIVDVHAIVRNVIAIFTPEIQAKVLTISLWLRAKQFHVWADPGRFQQMLLNLLSNAVKFTPSYGSISVKTENENGTIGIEVSDTGVGIEPDLMPRLFEPFEQGEQKVTRQFGGLGLGLSIVKSLVELHKATIYVTSEGPNKGASFTLRMETVAPSHRQPNELTPAATPEKTYRVLLVEDHDDTRQIMKFLLASFGCIVTTASSVKEAIEIADREKFDLLLSDLGLPDGSGLDVMKHIAANLGVPGIALSGFGQDEDLRKSREAGFATHLIKPVNLETLQKAIRSVAK